MTAVITKAQARQITGGRTPLVPVEFEKAVQALVACRTLDEAKYWHDKADALAAWGKIYHSNQIMLEAKRLKWHAYKRMAELSDQVPYQARQGKIGGRQPGPAALLRAYGLTPSQASDCRFVGQIPADEFAKIIASPNPPSPSTLARRSADVANYWKQLRGGSHNPFVCSAFIRNNSPGIVAKRLNAGDRLLAEETLSELADWIERTRTAIKARR